MLKGTRLHQALYSLGSFCINIGGAVSAVMGVLIELPVRDSSQSTLPRSAFLAHQWLQDQALYIFAVAFLLIALGQLSRRLGDPATRMLAQHVLNLYQRQIFPESDHTHYHRITVFKHTAICGLFAIHRPVRGRWYWPWGKNAWPWSGWLVPILRSGHTNQKPSSIFLAPENEPDRAEGIAGNAWSRNNTVHVSNLDKMVAESSPAKRREYAEKTFTPVELIDLYIRANKPIGRSFAAFPIEVKGNVWGVVVIDSRAPDGVTNENLSMVTPMLAILSRLFERRI